MTAQASRISRRDIFTVALVICTLLSALLIVVTQSSAGVDPNESEGRATSSVVIAPESSATLTARCPDGQIADGGSVEVRPSDALVVATAGMAIPGSSQWTVGAVSSDSRPVTVVASARCGPEPRPAA